jgi:hypothetical protein
MLPKITIEKLPNSLFEKMRIFVKKMIMHFDMRPEKDISMSSIFGWKTTYDNALEWGAKNGHLKVVQFLVENCEYSCKERRVFNWHPYMGKSKLSNSWL